MCWFRTAQPGFQRTDERCRPVSGQPETLRARMFRIVSRYKRLSISSLVEDSAGLTWVYTVIFTYVYRRAIYRWNAAHSEPVMPQDDGAVCDRSPEMAMPGEDVVPVHIVNTCFGQAQMVPARPP